MAGAGIVGCEVAGELAVAFGKEKKLGICLRGDKLMHLYTPQVGEVVEEFLKNHNVNVYKNVNFNEQTAKELDYELVI